MIVSLSYVRKPDSENPRRVGVIEAVTDITKPRDLVKEETRDGNWRSREHLKIQETCKLMDTQYYKGYLVK